MSETRQWVERFEALRDDLATGDLCHVQKWIQNDGALTEIAEGIARLTAELEEARERERVNRLAAIVALSSAESVISWAIKHYVRVGRMDNTLGHVRVALRILGKPPVDSHTVALLMEEPSWSFGQAVRRALATDTEVSDGE